MIAECDVKLKKFYTSDKNRVAKIKAEAQAKRDARNQRVAKRMK